MATNDENIRDAIAERAAEWFVTNASGFHSERERRQFVAWLRSSPAHVEEYLAVATIASELPTAAAMVERALRGAPMPLRTARRPTKSLAAVARSYSRSILDAGGTAQLRAALASAGALLVAALVVGAWWVHRTAQQALPVSYHTVHGQQGVWVLPDGSRIRLNTDSAVTVSLTRIERVAQLTRGQVYFEVAHEQRRPFRVAVNGAQLTALGTQFDVYRQENRAVVTVVDGRVAVIPFGAASVRSDPNQTTSQVLGAGQRMLIRQGFVAVPEQVDLAQAQAWLNRQVIFRRRPLGEAVDEFNRYTPTHIEITDPLARAIAVSGVFDAYDTESFLAFVGTIDGLAIQDVPQGNKLISRTRAARSQLPAAP
jgi:transmembrane sensor